MGEIINKVKSLDVITIDVKDFYAEGERAQIDLLDFLEGDILMEKNFRDKLKKFNWTVSVSYTHLTLPTTPYV